MDIDENPSAGDETVEKNGLKVFVDKDAMSSLSSKEIDYVKNDQGEGFVINGEKKQHLRAGQAAAAADKTLLMFPYQRPRRLRKNETIRRMVRETSLSPDDFIYPLFVTFGERPQRNQINAGMLPGVGRQGRKTCERGLFSRHTGGNPFRHT